MRWEFDRMAASPPLTAFRSRGLKFAAGGGGHLAKQLDTSVIAEMTSVVCVALV